MRLPDRLVGGNRSRWVAIGLVVVVVAFAVGLTFGFFGSGGILAQEGEPKATRSVDAEHPIPPSEMNPVTVEVIEEIFEDMRDSQFLPANEAYRDNTRKELDHRVLVDMLGLPESILEPLDLLRLKWCSEPSVHGGKSTAPGA